MNIIYLISKLKLEREPGEIKLKKSKRVELNIAKHIMYCTSNSVQDSSNCEYGAQYPLTVLNKRTWLMTG